MRMCPYPCASFPTDRPPSVQAAKLHRELQQMRAEKGASRFPLPPARGITSYPPSPSTRPQKRSGRATKLTSEGAKRERRKKRLTKLFVLRLKKENTLQRHYKVHISVNFLSFYSRVPVLKLVRLCTQFLMEMYGPRISWANYHSGLRRAICVRAGPGLGWDARLSCFCVPGAACSLQYRI